MAERGPCDVWLLQLEGDDKTRLMAASRLLRVDVRAAQHILENLPRLAARGVAPEAARKLVQQIQALGGVGHLCASGETPDFKAVARAAVRRAAASRTRLSGEVAAEAARAVQDAAMLRWPEDGSEPYAWEADDAQLPPHIPHPVRHSAMRVAVALGVTLAVLAGGASAYWLSYGNELTRVSAASWETPDAGSVDEPDGGLAGAPSSEPADAAMSADEAAVLAPPPK